MHKEKQAQVCLNPDKIQLYSATRLLSFAYILGFKFIVKVKSHFSQPLKVGWGQSLCHLLIPVMFLYKWHSGA